MVVPNVLEQNPTLNNAEPQPTIVDDSAITKSLAASNSDIPYPLLHPVDEKVQTTDFILRLAKMAKQCSKGSRAIDASHLRIPLLCDHSSAQAKKAVRDLLQDPVVNQGVKYLIVNHSLATLRKSRTLIALERIREAALSKDIYTQEFTILQAVKLILEKTPAALDLRCIIKEAFLRPAASPQAENGSSTEDIARMSAANCLAAIGDYVTLLQNAKAKNKHSSEVQERLVSLLREHFAKFDEVSMFLKTLKK